jgi:predicted metalloprotease
MRWTPGGRSQDLEDRRGQSGGRGGLALGGLGLGGVLFLGVLSLVFGKNFFALLDPGTGPAQRGPVEQRPTDPQEEKLVQFVSFVIDDVQNTWTKVLSGGQQPYRRAKLVLFTDQVRSGCGFAEAAMGPFYCPGDEKVYVDLGFYRELRSRFGAPGDFAQAYVIAHEVGHHVQNLLGIEAQVRDAQQRNPRSANQLSVRMELQADCLAGVWAHSTAQRNILEAGDVEEGMNAAAAVGDDRIQSQAGQRVNPENFTHGSSKQRVQWFQQGFTTGRVESCDTYKR